MGQVHPYGCLMMFAFSRHILTCLAAWCRRGMLLIYLTTSSTQAWNDCMNYDELWSMHHRSAFFLPEIGLLTWGEVDKETDLVDAGSQTTRVLGSPRFLGVLGSLDAASHCHFEAEIELLLIKTVCRTGCFFQSVSAPSSAWLFEESRFVWRDWITRASFRCDSIPTGFVSVGRSFTISISKYKPYFVIHDAYL